MTKVITTGSPALVWSRYLGGARVRSGQDSLPPAEQVAHSGVSRIGDRQPDSAVRSRQPGAMVTSQGRKHRAGFPMGFPTLSLTKRQGTLTSMEPRISTEQVTETECARIA